MSVNEKIGNARRVSSYAFGEMPNTADQKEHGLDEPRYFWPVVACEIKLLDGTVVKETFQMGRSNYGFKRDYHRKVYVRGVLKEKLKEKILEKYSG
ncbi:MAG: hypothetical protein HY513_02265 [Candidatus Aenigmarchaeota archaeon]|nr:hypothetical protein [Candidatus Aenigmarchaeota archaeon]